MVSLPQAVPPSNMGRIRKQRSRSRGRTPIYDDVDRASTSSNVLASLSRASSPTSSAGTSATRPSQARLRTRRPPPDSISPRITRKSSASLHRVIPDYPPPSFEEAVLSLSGYETVPRATPERNRTKSPSIKSLSTSSTSSDSEVEIVEAEQKPSQWELDLRAGFPLEERVKREWERRHAENITTPILIPDKTSAIKGKRRTQNNEQGPEELRSQHPGSLPSDSSFISLSPISLGPGQNERDSDWEILDERSLQQKCSGTVRVPRSDQPSLRPLVTEDSPPSSITSNLNSIIHTGNGDVGQRPQNKTLPLRKHHRPPPPPPPKKNLPPIPKKGPIVVENGTVKEPSRDDHSLGTSSLLLRAFDPFYTPSPPPPSPPQEDEVSSPTPPPRIATARPLPTPPRLRHSESPPDILTAYEALRGDSRSRDNSESPPEAVRAGPPSRRRTVEEFAGPDAHVQPFGDITELDVLVSRLEDDATGRGDNYEELLLVGEVLGNVSAPEQRRSTISHDLPVGKVEVLRRRTTREGRVKLKLSLLGLAVDKCGICLSQFKESNLAAMLPKCSHSYHEKCIRTWLLKSTICPICRQGID